MQIKFSPPDITESEISEVVDTLRSGWITTGPKTKQFEKEIAAFCGPGTSVCLNSATAALELTLRVLGIGEGDEVIVPAYTYTASASVITHVGARTVIVDTAKDFPFYDPQSLADAVTPATKAVITVDLAGIMCDYDSIYAAINSRKDLFIPKNEIQRTYGRPFIIADGAHSLGAFCKGRKSGQAADFTTFSFHAVKNLTTGEGGAVTWKENAVDDDDAIYRLYQLLSLHGQSKDALAKTSLGAWEYDIVAPYYKCNMTDILASIGLAQLRRYEQTLNRRHEIIKMYNDLCDKHGLWRLSHEGKDFRSSGHLFFVRFPGKDIDYRNSFITKLAAKGVGTNVHYKPLPLLTAYADMGYDINDFPNAYEIYETEISLPLHNLLSDEEVLYVCREFEECL